jgi:hypothetical protein
MQEAIKRAIEGGWKPKQLNDRSLQGYQFHRYRKNYSTWYKKYSKDNEPTYCYLPHEVSLLDPEFWKCLGKSEGWESGCGLPRSELCACRSCWMAWKYYWLDFIDHLAQGGTIDEFFEKILKP